MLGGGCTPWGHPKDEDKMPPRNQATRFMFLFYILFSYTTMYDSTTTTTTLVARVEVSPHLTSV